MANEDKKDFNKMYFAPPIDNETCSLWKSNHSEEYPGGAETQKAMLEAEGHTIIEKGRKISDIL